MTSRHHLVRHVEHAETSPRFWQLIYFLLTVILGGMFVWTLFPDVEIRTSLGLIFFALLLLTLKRWTGALLLTLILLHLFYFDPREFLEVSPAASFLWVFLSVMLLTVVSRYRTLQEQDRQSVVISLTVIWKATAAPTKEETEVMLDNLKQVSLQLAKAAFVITFCAFVATILLYWVPLNSNARGLTIQEYRLKPTGYRAIMLGLKLFCLGLVSWVAVNELIWRNLSPRQAGVYLRSTFLGWIHRDLRMVVTRRLKLRRSGSRAMEPAARDAEVPDPPLNAEQKR